MPKILYRCAINTAIPCIIISMASLFGVMLARAGFGFAVVNFFTNISDNPTIVIISIIVMLFIVGLFLEATVAMLILAPLLAPIGDSLGFDPVHFGMIIVITLLVGTITPPVGLQLCVGASIAKVSITSVSIWPYVGAMMAFVFLCVLFPQIITFLPRTVLGF